MGTNKWDKIAASDAQISHSLPRLLNPKHIFILHRDLKMSSPNEAHVIALSLADEGLFRVVVPPFLRNWHGSKDRWLLDDIAHAIEAGKFANRGAVRFGVSPIPNQTSAKKATHFFEIRFIVGLDEIIRPPLTAAKVASYLGQTGGVLNRPFKRGVNAMLAGLKNPKVSSLHGSFPEFDKLIKKIFSPTRKK